MYYTEKQKITIDGGWMLWIHANNLLKKKKPSHIENIAPISKTRRPLLGSDRAQITTAWERVVRDYELGRLFLVARIFGDVIKFGAKSSELSLLKTSHKNYANASRLFTFLIERLTERLKRSEIQFIL